MDLGEQIDHALGFAGAFEEARTDSDPGAGASGLGPGPWMDLGSGGGLPGLVLAEYWPDSVAVLLDAAARRTAFLSEAVDTLGWSSRVQVVRERAEVAGLVPAWRAGFDVVWARSFGSPPVTAECAAPFLHPDGLLVVSEPPETVPGSNSGPHHGPGARWPREGLAELGQEPLVTVRERFGYQVIRQVTTCPERFPRRSGVAAKRPLYRVAEG